MMPPCSYALVLAMVLLGSATLPYSSEAANPNADFVRQVLPLLRRSCFECHSARKQESGLRLDTREGALRGGDSGTVIVPGNADKSELIARISRAKMDEGVMPAQGDPLTPEQINVLRSWINAGAPWPDNANSLTHWSYLAPVPPLLPAVRNSTWSRTSIDYFVLARLESVGLQPSPPADPLTLVRRLYFDLTGLPPSLPQVDAFLAETDSDAYERLVDRLLASPQFGVRWARPWLDYARYADSHGFQRDDFRDLWAYRDWVVSALNSDMPFDQFTIEQLAGDLLPDASESQKIASGFNRNAPTNVEAGSDPEETRVNQVFDRVNTLGMVWLGTTLECCQCHDHKYDPFTMRDYYGMFAFFNNSAIEADRSNPKVPGSIRFLGPELTLRDENLENARTQLKQKLDHVTRELRTLEEQYLKPDKSWEAMVLDSVASAPQEHVLAIDEFDSLGGATHELLNDKSVLLSGEAPDRDTYTLTTKTRLSNIRAVKLETLTDPSLPGNGPGRGDAQRPNFVLNTFSLLSVPANGGDPKPVEFSRATADFSQQRFDVAGAIDKDPKTAWAINPKFHEPHWAVFETANPIGDGSETVLTFRLEQNFGSSRTIGRLRLTAVTGNYGGQTVPADVVAALRVDAEGRSNQQARVIAAFRLKDHVEFKQLKEEQVQLDAELAKLKLPTTLHMQEVDQPRPATMFVRGDFRHPGLPVEPMTPAILPSLPRTPADHGPSNNPSLARPTRLDLARWLVKDDNPLTARVVVNRWWAELFGRGLVATPEDFGVRGDLPSHPELLDWLALEYMRQNWSLKRLLKTVVLSATYRQNSRVTPELLARDDQNFLFARGPRFRLDAESIRDNALAIAGLLSLNQGGAPIRPYQPDGIWIKVGGQRYDYMVSPGEQRYRRGLYVVWKRGAPYPSFINFDANNRLACRVQRPRSNTPLQALTLMNDPVYVEAAQALAKRVVDETPRASVLTRIEYAFRLALIRPPRQQELDALSQLFSQQLAASRQASDAAKLFASQHSAPSDISPEEFVAWYAVAAALLNLDETTTKG